MKSLNIQWLTKLNKNGLAIFLNKRTNLIQHEKKWLDFGTLYEKSHHKKKLLCDWLMKQCTVQVELSVVILHSLHGLYSLKKGWSFFKECFIYLGTNNICLLKSIKSYFLNLKVVSSNCIYTQEMHQSTYIHNNYTNFV